MSVFGIDAGVSSTAVVRLTGGRLELMTLPPSLADPLPSANTMNVRWAVRAHDVVDEIVSKGWFPLAVDAALTVASRGAQHRRWETYHPGAYRTPYVAKMNRANLWHRIARLWSHVARLLVLNHGFSIWEGQPVAAQARVLVEAYPRVSWAAVRAQARHLLAHDYRRCPATWRDDLLDHVGCTWLGPVAGLHARDAAVCALTAESVMLGTAGYLGEAVGAAIVPYGAHTGGGIAVPMLARDVNGAFIHLED